MAYHGPGLAIEALAAAGKRGDALSLLEEENAQLREDVAYLQQLLSVWQPQPCSICRLHAAPNSSSSAGTGRPPAASAAARVASSTHAAIEKIIRQQQVLIAQQQRQLQVLQVELSSREQVLLEAEAVLAETHRRITTLAAWATSQQASQGGTGTQQQQQQQQQRMAAPPGTASSSRRLASSSRPGTSSSVTSSVWAASVGASAAATASRAGLAAGACSSMQQVWGVVLEQCRSLLAWCRESEARMARSKAASAAQCRAPAAAAAAAGRGHSSAGRRAASSMGGGSSSSKQQWHSPDKAAPASPEDVQQALQLPYLPAGGNTFLQPGTTLTLAGIASGQGLSALAAAALPQLLQQLASLAAPLAALAVQLRSSILPALPWLQAGQLGPELTTSCARLAQQAAAAAVQLSELCALLPAAPATLSAPAAAAARKAQAGQAAAAAEAGAWGCPRSSSQHLRQQQQSGPSAAEAVSDTAVCSDTAAAGVDSLQLEAEDAALLGQLAGLLLQHRKGPQAQHSQQHKGPGSHTAAKEQAAAAAALERLQQRLHVLALKQRVLNEQLAFLAQCSAAAAKLMTQLSADVVQALAAAIDAVEPPSLQQQRSRALQLCSQLQRASLLAQQQSSASSGSGLSTARTVLALLDSNRDVLDEMPKLLAAASSASTLKAAATAAVVAALNEFRAGLQP